MTQVFIRTAMPDDVQAIRDVLVTTWHHTYDDLIGAEKVRKITDAWHSVERLKARFEVPDSEFLVADTGREIVAVAFATQMQGDVTVHQLYVLPSHQRRGAGEALMRELAGCFIDVRRFTLEVAARNRQAIAFYEAMGFAICSGEAVIDGNTGLEHIEMTLDVPQEARWTLQ